MNRRSEGHTTEMRNLPLSRLHQGMPGITPEVGDFLAQGAAVCLESQGHAPGAVLRLKGTYTAELVLSWPRVSAQVARSWRDMQEATEYGASGVAALLVELLTDYTVVERSWKGTGFDYWLALKGAGQALFQGRARLEVSGILHGNERDMVKRLEVKMKQADRSHRSLSKIAVIVEFSMPASRLEQR